MESFYVKDPAEFDILVKCEMEFDVKSEPDIVMEDQIEPDVTKRDIDTGVQVKNEPQAPWVGREPADVRIKSGPEVVWIKSEPRTDFEMDKKFETDLEKEFDFGAGTKTDNLVVRIFCILF